MMKQELVRVRRAQTSDISALMEVQRESWHGAYQGLMPGSDLRYYDRKHSRIWWRQTLTGNGLVLIACFAGETIGYLIAGHCRRRPLPRHGGQYGEVAEFYLLPVYQGLGFGGRLLRRAEKYFKYQGYRGYFVNVLSENDQARDIYEHCGGELMHWKHRDYARHGDEILNYYFPLRGRAE